MTKNNMRVLAIDPGYERLGVAVLEKNESKEKVLYSDCVMTSKDTPHPKRIHTVYTELQSILTRFPVDQCAIETLFFNANQKTALKVAEMRGALFILCEEHKIPIREFSPQAIKISVTGYGKSDKHAVMKMIPLLVQIDKKIKYDDEFDAIAIGLTALNTQIS